MREPTEGGGISRVAGRVCVVGLLLNSNVVLVANEVYGPALGQPLTILQGRIFRATVQVKF